MVARVKVELTGGFMKSSSGTLAIGFDEADELVASPTNSSASARVPNFLYFALTISSACKSQRWSQLTYALKPLTCASHSAHVPYIPGSLPDLTA
jgi:hypothetical protein